MGVYLNPGNVDFQKSLNSEIYIDKTELIAYTNKKLNTEQGYICVSRPRRFGKSMAANMLTAYYSRGCDSREMFENLKISKADSFEKHLNKYNVISFDMQKFLVKTESVEEMIQEMEEEILDEEIENLIAERQAARKAKDFARADEIRGLLLDKGIELKDTREGVKWKRI